MKVQGGIKEVWNNKSSLEEHFSISYEMSQITEAFLESLRSKEIDRTIINWLWELTRELSTMLENWNK